MGRRSAVAACLVFSGLTALVYQIIWVRLLGFTFGTTTEAVSTVLAVFFGGLALGNLWAAARLSRVERPLRVYALLELGIGLYALASLPLLQGLASVDLLIGAGQGPWARTGIRLLGSALLLLPPTIAMGATLPVVARGLVTEDASVGRWSALLYASNTLGAVLGAYLCGFWLIPTLGLTRTVVAAGVVNLGVAAALLAVAGGLRAAAMPTPVAGMAPAEGGTRGRAVFLFFFFVSGFVAIGYEIIWSKVFGIVMEGTLYGFAAVLSAFLLGIALGSFLIAPRVDRIRDLPRAFGWLHAAIAVAVALGIRAVPDLPYWMQRLSGLEGIDPLHRLYLLVVPIVLVPTALFGAAFPVLVRIIARQAAAAGSGIGVATAVNTTGSILASLVVGFLWIPTLGMDRSLEILLLLDGGVALLALAAFQTLRGWRAIANVAGCAAALAVAFGSFDGVQVDRAIAGQLLRAPKLADYQAQLDRELASQRYRREGRTAVVTVYVLPTHRLLRTNGLPEAGYALVPPYYTTESMLLGVLPYLLVQGEARRGLVVGLGGGNTLDALLHTGLERIDLVELERAVIDAIDVFAEGRANPLHDPRVEVIVNDGRNELLLAAHDGRPAYDVIASQPSHPWRIGAASLFTEEYFALARSRLSAGGRFALWVSGFRIDRESFLAIVTSFERIFPGSLLFDGSHGRSRSDFLLIGGREPVVIDPVRVAQRMREPRLAALLGRFGFEAVEDLLAGFEGPGADFARISPDARNTDDLPFVETRVPRDMRTNYLDFGVIESQVDASAPALPPLSGPVDVARIARVLLDARVDAGSWAFGPKLERLLALHADGVDPVLRESLLAELRIRNPELRRAQAAEVARLRRENPTRPEPWRVLAGARRAVRDWELAAEAYAEAWQRSKAPADAFAAGQSLAMLDPGRAAEWFARIPAEARPAFPEIAVVEAQQAVERGADGAELREAYAALRAFRDTREGRARRDVDELLERIAWSLGDAQAARAYADLARERRRGEASAVLARVRRAIAAQRYDDAASGLAEAQRLLPADSSVLALAAQLAFEQEDPIALAQALEGLRAWAPTFEAAIQAENRFRQENGLPLLPALSADAILSQPPPPVPGDGSAATPTR